MQPHNAHSIIENQLLQQQPYLQINWKSVVVIIKREKKSSGLEIKLMPGMLMNAEHQDKKVGALQIYRMLVTWTLSMLNPVAHSEGDQTFDPWGQMGKS
jgi:hypothetical protein